MKPHVHGLKALNGIWFYVADCPKCQWSFNWDHHSDYTWDYVMKVALNHWWMNSDLASHR